MKYLFIIFLFMGSCIMNKLPDERLSQFRINVNYEFKESELKLTLTNPLHCPIRIWVKSEDPNLNSKLQMINPIILSPLKDSLFIISADEIEREKLEFSAKLGDTSKQIMKAKVGLPFQPGKSYELIQGPNSEPTHNDDWSRYALDFGLSIGDTVCAATDGYVVGVIEDYKSGGKGSEWKAYGNFITIYDPESGLFTQYVHLVYKGSLVNVGDKVHSGQIIGISGMTGQTSIEHLHFNSLKPSNSDDGLSSFPIDSIGPYKISELKRYQLVSNQK